MKFATSKKIRLKSSEEVIRVRADKTFNMAAIYPSGWICQDQVFELTEFRSYDKDSSTLLDVLGIIQPSRIQFEAIPSHVTAVASYDEGFYITMYIDTVEYIINEVEAFFISDSDVPLFITKSGTDCLKNILRKNAVFTVSPEAYELHDEVSIEATAEALRDILINFWVDCPGYSDGSEKGSSLEEIKAYLSSRKKNRAQE